MTNYFNAKSTCQVTRYIMQYTLLYVQVAGFLSNCVVSALQAQLSKLHANHVYSTLARETRNKRETIKDKQLEKKRKKQCV